VQITTLPPYPKGKAVRSWLWSSCQPLIYGIQRVVEAPQRAAEEQDKQKSSALLNDVAARLGNQDAAKELIELRAGALFASSTGDAECFAHELLAQLSEKQGRYKALQDNSAMEAMRRRLEWEPFLRAFLEQFDHHVAALRSRGIDMTITPVDGSVFMGEVVFVQSDPRQQFVVRYVRTTGGYELRVRVSTGQVDFGKVTGFPSFELVGTRGGDIDRYFLEITFGPTHVAWNLGIGRDNRRSGGHIIGRDSQTEAYRQAVRDGLNLAFEYAVLVTTK
jgi:hypothetical protein